MLAVRENEERNFNDEDTEINNKDFWYSYKRNDDGLRWVAKFFMGRPPTHCEDERDFSRTGITVSPRRAYLYPETVENFFFLSNVIQFFEFVLYELQ